ncbi:MAG: hypothetical protein PUD80_03215, partial [Firmicutes bacterium]|nr:hypothetical protein [Bacillota bacterium]
MAFYEEHMNGSMGTVELTNDEMTMEEIQHLLKAVENAAAKKAGTGTVKGHLSADDLKKMKLDDLKAMAEDWGLDVSNFKTKADYVAA